jgi:DNA-binding response OmpR family regulator
MPRILVLDDEPLISMMMQDWLAELACETVGPASSVRGALTLIKTVAVDAAILDVSLRSENCYPVADALCKLGIPIAFATGHGGEAIDPRFNDALILSKPFDFEVVKGVVDRLISARNQKPVESEASELSPQSRDPDRAL